MKNHTIKEFIAYVLKKYEKRNDVKSLYIVELAEGLYDDIALSNPRLMRKALLNGADDWRHYSFSGCSLCYNSDIMERFGYKRHFSGESLLCRQANMLRGAACEIERLRLQFMAEEF